MADLDRIKREIAEIAQRRKAVSASEIQRVVSQLGACGHKVRERPTTHGRLYTIEGVAPFSVCEHNRGSRFVKPVYVDSFLDAMAELGLVEE